VKTSDVFTSFVSSSRCPVLRPPAAVSKASLVSSSLVTRHQTKDGLTKDSPRTVRLTKDKMTKGQSATVFVTKDKKTKD
jgi:hypothetical protein